MERHEIKAIIIEALDESSGFKLHEAHHEWIQTRIDREKERCQMCREITKSVMQWSVIGILGYMLVWIKDHYLP